MRSGAVFPWRGDNRFELLVDGARFFPRMLDAIAAAQRQVELELYLDDVRWALTHPEEVRRSDEGCKFCESRPHCPAWENE